MTAPAGGWRTVIGGAPIVVWKHLEDGLPPLWAARFTAREDGRVAVVQQGNYLTSVEPVRLGRTRDEALGAIRSLIPNITWRKR